ncbi:MAG: M3 family metallopeptidase [Bacteroidales bacterium]|jgi:peptidyl-dipeptidase Dcp|nr:M3 family metallopeptidase [Bacteroidales bacterium]
MKKYLYLVSLSLLCVGNVSAQKQNPFLEEWTTPYGIPPFDKIKVEHYIPAFEVGMKEQKAAISAIVNNKEKPNFENTILALENSGLLLSKVSSVFSNLRSAHTNKEYQEIAIKMLPQLSQHSDEIYLNVDLFKKVEEVYKSSLNSKMGVEEKRLVETYHKSFVRSGVNLPPAEREKIKNINSELSLLTLKFGDNLLADNNKFALIIDNQNDLAGLPASVAQAAKEEAASRGLKNKWVFTLDKHSMIPFLQFAENKKLREQIYKAYLNRANNNDQYDNKENVVKIAKLRLEKAKLLGYENHASFVLEENMAKAPHKVFELIKQIWEPAVKMAKKEEEALIKKAFTHDERITSIEPADWWYYAEQIRKENYDINEEELREYFKLENVRDGIFWVSNKLYGVKFTQKTKVPSYHEEVTTWEVTEKNGKLLGVLMMDFFPRASKRGGAWCTSYRVAHYEDGKRVTPVVSIVCNFTKPTSNKPSLLTLDETETFFHEFGHALHSLFNNVKYRSIARVPRDFVELPSQVMEHWATHPDVMKQYAKHYKTNKVIPDELIEKIEKSSKFNQGFATTEFLAAAYLDMMYHTKDVSNINVEEFEASNLSQFGLINSILPRYRSTYFQHIFAGGYSAGYYSYIWSEVLDSDAFEAFLETGDIFNQKVAKRFREKILERGNTIEPYKMYLEFRGKEPNIEPLLKNRGLM